MQSGQHCARFRGFSLAAFEKFSASRVSASSLCGGLCGHGMLLPRMAQVNAVQFVQNNLHRRFARGAALNPSALYGQSRDPERRAGDALAHENKIRVGDGRQGAGHLRVLTIEAASIGFAAPSRK